MERMRKQKGKKVKSKFKSALMSEFSKKVMSKKTFGFRGKRRIQTVQEIQEEPETDQQKYSTQKRRKSRDAPEKSQPAKPGNEKMKSSFLRKSQARAEVKMKRSMIESKEKDSRMSRGSNSFRKNQESSLLSIRNKNSSKYFSRDSKRKKSRSILKKQETRVDPVKLENKFREFQKELEQQTEQLRQSKGHSKEGNSYLSGWSQKQRVDQRPIEYGKRKEFRYCKAPRKKLKPRPLRKSVNRKKTGEDANGQSESVRTKAQRISISTKAITETNVGAEAELIDDEELVKFMVIKKNKIKQIRQQSLITLAELKKKGPERGAEGGGLDDIEVENVVMQEPQAQAKRHFPSGKYHNPRNSLALLREKSKQKKRRKSSELKCKTKDIKLQEYFLNSDLENSENDKLKGEKKEVELKSESRQVKMGEELKHFGKGKMEKKESQSEWERKEKEELKKEGEEEKRRKLKEKEEKEEKEREEKERKEREKEEKEREEKERKKREEKEREEKEKRIREKERKRKKEDEEKKREEEERIRKKEEDRKREKEEEEGKGEEEVKIEERETEDQQMGKGQKEESEEKIENEEEESMERNPSLVEIEMIQKMKENLKVMRKTFDFGKKNQIGKSRIMEEKIKTEKIENKTENQNEKKEEPSIKNKEKKTQFEKNETKNPIEKSENSEQKETKLPEKDPFEDKILENIEQMSEEDIIKNGQKIILKNLNNKEFIKQVLSEVKKIKQKEKQAPNEEEKSEETSEVNTSKENSEKEENLSIITLGSDTEEFEEDEGEVEEIREEKEDEAGNWEQEPGRENEEERKSEGIKSGQKIVISRNSLPLTEATEESLFQWDSNYNEEIASIQRSAEISKSKNEEEKRESTKELRVSQYREEPSQAHLNRELVHRLGTFRKHNKSREKGELESPASPTKGKSLADDTIEKYGTNFEKIQKLKQSNLEENLAKLKKNFHNIKKSTQEIGNNQNKEKFQKKDFIDNFGNYMETHKTEEKTRENGTENGTEPENELEEISQEEELEKSEEVLQKSEKSVNEIQIRNADNDSENEVQTDADSIEEESQESDINLSQLEEMRSEEDSNGEEKRRVNESENEEKGETEEDEKLEPNQLGNHSKRRSTNDIEEIKKKLKNARQNEEDLESSELSEFKDDFSVDNNCSIESNYKETSKVSTDEVHSLEDCQFFLLGLIEIFEAASRSRLGSAFERILIQGNRRNSSERKEYEHRERTSSKKKVIIKKRTLKGTELEKINLRNKSYSG